MNEGTNKVLSILIGVIIFGILLSLTYWFYYGNYNLILEDTMFKTSNSISKKLEVTLGDQKMQNQIPTDVSYFEWLDNGDDTVTITGFKGKRVPGESFEMGEDTGTLDAIESVVIPEQIEGKAVVAIGDSVFNGKLLTSVTLPSTLKSIGNFAFHSNYLTNLILPSNLTDIGNYAFNSNQIGTLTLPDSINNVGVEAFAQNNLTFIYLPNKDVTYSEGAFRDNSLLKTITIPTNQTTLPDLMFIGCGLESLDLTGSNLTTIGYGAFLYNKLESLKLNEGLITLGDSVFAGNQLTTVKIPSSLNEISAGLFSENQITDITIPDTIKTIKTSAFSSNLLKSITIPDSITKIESFTFSENQLTSINLPNTLTEIQAEAFSYNNLKTITIPKSIKLIGFRAFRNNNLTDVTLDWDAVTVYDSGTVFSPYTDTFDENVTINWEY